MKTAILAGIFTLLNVTFNWIPSTSLLMTMGLAIVLDFVTGVIKAVVLKNDRTSEGYRRSVVKFTQYVGAVLVSMLLSYLAEQNQQFIQLQTYINYLGNGLLSFIIFIEATSVFENMYAIDNKTPFSRYFIKPLLKILTFQIANNPLTKIKDEEVKP